MICLVILVGCGSRQANEPTPTAAVEQVDDGAYVIRSGTAEYVIQEQFLADATNLSTQLIPNTNLTTVGSARSVRGRLYLDDLSRISGTITVDLTTLRTNRPLRDERLQVEWLQTVIYPTATFEISSSPSLPANATSGEQIAFPLTGMLTIRDVSREVTFDVVASLDGEMLEGRASAEIRMTDFGIDPPSLAKLVAVEDEMQIQIELTASR